MRKFHPIPRKSDRLEQLISREARKEIRHGVNEDKDTTQIPEQELVNDRSYTPALQLQQSLPTPLKEHANLELAPLINQIAQDWGYNPSVVTKNDKSEWFLGEYQQGSGKEFAFSVPLGESNIPVYISRSREEIEGTLTQHGLSSQESRRYANSVVDGIMYLDKRGKTLYLIHNSITPGEPGKISKLREYDQHVGTETNLLALNDKVSLVLMDNTLDEDLAQGMFSLLSFEDLERQQKGAGNYRARELVVPRPLEMSLREVVRLKTTDERRNYGDSVPFVYTPESGIASHDFEHTVEHFCPDQ